MIINNKLAKDSMNQCLIKKQQLTIPSLAIRLLSVTVLTTMLVACGGGSDGGSKTNSSNTNTDANTQQDAGQSDSHTPVKIQPNQGDDIVNDKHEDEIRPDNGNHKNDGESSGAIDVSNLVPEVKPVSDNNASNTTIKQSDILSPSELTAFNRLNLRRMECGFGKLEVDKTLYNAAKNHTNYLLYMNKHSLHSFQGHSEKQVDQFSGKNNPYFTGNSISQRIKTGKNIGNLAIPVNYSYKLAGENLSFLRFNQSYKEKYGEQFIAENSVNSLLAAPYHMASMLEPKYTQVGISYGQDRLKKPMILSNGQSVEGFGSVLEMVLARPLNKKVKPLNKVLTYPCDGTKDTQYQLTHEDPNPFGHNGRNLQKNPIGQPVYILANGDLTVTNYKMTDAAGKNIPLKALTKITDPNKLLTESQVILLPLEPLKPSQSYRVSYKLSVDGSATQDKTIIFHTKAG